MSGSPHQSFENPKNCLSLTRRIFQETIFMFKLPQYFSWAASLSVQPIDFRSVNIHKYESEFFLRKGFRDMYMCMHPYSYIW